jgi:hypothetical protein
MQAEIFPEIIAIFAQSERGNKACWLKVPDYNSPGKYVKTESLRCGDTPNFNNT